ncbi:hypothetical protein BO221_45075 [Archangium sp. Cb G35]|uniref:hypothetical protein n=1 Tax=Archangium sp. Cb G35 TaxID=1920190 RepID=UPI0009358A33|nr:hypothetical protein [Archangium sp. Cb G35]OJT17301.1 hypothetical protein BO221_45075 [Archangium sp. Cb G35]
MTPESPHRSASLPVNDTARRGPKIAIALGAVALLAAVALLSRGSSAEGGQPESSQAEAPPPSSNGPAASKAGNAQGGPAQAESKPKQFNSTVCWEDLERFNESVTLETFRDWAGPLLAVKDPLVLDYLKGRLAELIGDDAGRAGEVLDWALDASPAEFKLFMGGLRGSKALPKMASRLTELGLDEKLDLGRRAGFLDELQRMPRLEPAALDKLATFAQDAASGEAGWVTTRAIGRVMKEDYKKSGNFKPYLDKLLTISSQSADEQVRYLAAEMGMDADAPLDTKATERLGKLLATEGSEDVRMMAAHELSMSEDKAQALELYGKNFQIEKDLCVRWALFRFAARTAGKDALPVMADMAMTDPRFQGIYQEFEKLYASGIVDFDRIWFSLPTDDPFGCLDRHEE